MKHKIIHAEEKLYSHDLHCDVCDVDFGDGESLRKHVEIHRRQAKMNALSANQPTESSEEIDCLKEN